jgi:hypothetical protein
LNRFVRFGLGDPTVRVLGALPIGLPSRGRDVDGSYLIGWPRPEPQPGDGAEPAAVVEDRAVAHIEFHRRHQSLDELAVDVAEAQIRIYRREGIRVVSLVWDLYGKAQGPVTAPVTLLYGRARDGEPSSQCVYHRVNLRALGWKDLLAQAPPALWPLVALTRDGACDEAVHQAVNAIEGRADLSDAQRTEHLSVLWFVSEAEDVPVWIMRAYLTEDRLMASTLYNSAFEKGEAKGEAKGQADVLIRILMRRLGTLDATVRERIRATTDRETLSVWVDEALDLTDAEQARRLAEKIQRALAA